MKGGKEIEYPHIKVGDTVIPDCSRGVYRPFRLTSREKRALVKNIATRGLKGIDDFLSDPSSLENTKDKMDSIRERIEEQMERIRSKRKEGLDRQIRKLTEEAVIIQREVQDGMMDDSSFRRFSSEQIRGEVLASDLISVIEGRVELEDYQEKVGICRRIFRSMKRALIKVISTFMRFFKWIGALFRSEERSQERSSKKKEKGAISLPFPALQGDLSRLEEELERKLDQDTGLQRAVNQRMSDRYGYDEGYIKLKSSYDKEWYVDKAKEVLREEVKQQANMKEKELRELRSKRRSSNETTRKKESELRAKAFQLEKQLDSEIQEDSQRLEEMTKKEMKKELIDTLSFMGYLQRARGTGGIQEAEAEWEITEALVVKFSELLFSELTEKEGGVRDRPGRHVSDAGVYEKSRLRMTGEEARMDILQTMVNSRMNHPEDRHIERSDIVVNREVTTSELHAVLLVDVSGSMEENMRLDAAKRSVLALTQAIKRENPRNKVDIIKVSTRATPVSLKEVMGIEPRGFTNHQEAIAIARTILDGSRSERNLIFLITDGLPEAYVGKKGEAVAGDLEKAMELTLQEAALLNRIPNLAFQIFLLEPKDETFVGSARRIASSGYGSVIVADPRELAYKVVGEYLSTGEVLGGV